MNARVGRTAAATGTSRLLTRPMILLLVASVGGMGGFYLLLSVLPLYAATAGGGGVGAGLTTGAMMLATVLAEPAVPWFLARFGHRAVVGAGLLLLGLPSAVLCLWSSFPLTLGVCLARGMGLGIVVVAGTALAAELAPPGRRSESLGLYGVSLGVPSVLGLPAGVWLSDRLGFEPVFLMTAALTLLALPAVAGLPARQATRAERLSGDLDGRNGDLDGQHGKAEGRDDRAARHRQPDALAGGVRGAGPVDHRPFLLLSYGEQTTGAGIAGVLIGATPLLTLTIAAAALPTERATRRKVLGLLIGFAGVVVLIGPWTDALGSFGGQLACLGAALSYACGFVYVRKYLSPLGLAPMAAAASQLLAATVLQAVVTPFLTWHTPEFTLKVTLSIVALGLFSTGLAYVLYFRLIGDVGATTASAVNYVVPVASVLIGVVAFGESVTWNLLVGGLVVLAGVAYAENRLRQLRAKDPAPATPTAAPEPEAGAAAAEPVAGSRPGGAEEFR
ncbi:MFS transporter [Streptomyces arboris]|uniref:MFS transporter n=1 Tax=Streptomyces arboris TaxID=2600619 RepID=UPI003C2FA527